MAKGKDSAGVSPSVAERGTADSKLESAVSAAEVKAALKEDSASLELGATEIAEEAVGMSAHEQAKQMIDYVVEMREVVGGYHKRVEALARELAKDHAMHSRLTRLAHCLAEYRNGLGTI
jgi:hypothetical protein